MKYITEAESSAVITHDLAFAAMSEALAAACQADAHIFPAVIAHGSDPGNRFSLKSAADREVAGVKIGFNWPLNTTKGIPSHNSVIIVFDQEVGKIAAVIEAGVVNSYRTSAADAVATNLLARKEARVLAVFGAGNQAWYECQAIARVRAIDVVYVVNKFPDEAERFVQRLVAAGMKARVAEAREACENADIIVTATPSRAPLFEAQWVRPGTHVSCIGADSKGKQELPVELLLGAELFCDLPQQSTGIGEFQHIAGQARDGLLQVTPIGQVLTGAAKGRSSNQAITVFDTSGIALQDLYMGRRLLEALA